MKCHNSIGTKSNLIKESTNLAIVILQRLVRIIESQSSPEKGMTYGKTTPTSFGLGNYLGYDLPIGNQDLYLVAIITILVSKKIGPQPQ